MLTSINIYYDTVTPKNQVTAISQSRVRWNKNSLDRSHTSSLPMEGCSDHIATRCRKDA